MKSDKGIQFKITFTAAQTALHLACVQGPWSIDIVPLLLEARADPTLVDQDGETPLQLAQKRKDVYGPQILEMCHAAVLLLQPSPSEETDAASC